VTGGNFASTAAGANRSSGSSSPARPGLMHDRLEISGSQFANNAPGSGLDITAGTTSAALNLNGQVTTSTFATSANGVILQANNTSAVSFNTSGNTSFTR
jgi:hypothetical protein